VCGPALILAAAVVLPFLRKAFTIDDVTFLLQAQHVLADPLHPTAFDMVFQGYRIRLSNELVTGPIMAYLLVPAILMGGSESVAHLTQLIVLLAGICATAALAMRLGLTVWQASQAALLVAGTPTVLAMTATAMPDVVAMTFTVLGLERLLAWVQSRRTSTAIVTFSLLALGILSRPHVILVLLAAAWWLLPATASGIGEWRERTKVRCQAVWPLLGALALALAVTYFTRDPRSGTALHKPPCVGSSWPAQWSICQPISCTGRSPIRW
jgi:hypothetical protein